MTLLADGLLPEAIILLWRIQFGTFTTESVFPKYFEYSYGIDAPERLCLLIERDFAEVLSAFDSLKHVNATAKKNLLKSKSVAGLSKMKVADLDQALQEYFTVQELTKAVSIRGYALTERGQQALASTQAVVDRHPKKNF